MTGNEKELSEIKGYVARLYQMIRHRTAVSVEFLLFGFFSAEHVFGY